MSNVIQKPFTISQLSEMKKSDLSKNDLFLVSDTSEKDTKYASKKLTYETLSSAMSGSILQSDVVHREISATTSAAVHTELSSNITNYATIQKWVQDDGTEQFVLSCGKA